MAVEYTLEKTPASATASESDFPSRTRSLISLICWVATIGWLSSSGHGTSHPQKSLGLGRSHAGQLPVLNDYADRNIKTKERVGHGEISAPIFELKFHGNAAGLPNDNAKKIPCVVRDLKKYVIANSCGFITSRVAACRGRLVCYRPTWHAMECGGLSIFGLPGGG